MAIFKVIKELALGDDLEPDATYFIKEEGASAFSLFVTTSSGVPVPLEASPKALRFDFVDSVEWHVNHNLNRHPNHSIVINGQQWDTATQYPDSNNMILYFKRPQTGFVEVV